MIKITATGNLGKDAQVRQAGNDNSVCQFSIASTKKGYTTKNGVIVEDKTTWIDVQKWNVGRLSDYLKKGQKVAISGEYEVNEHDGKRYPFINADTIELLGSNPTQNQGGSSQAPPPPPPADEAEDDLPF